MNTLYQLVLHYLAPYEASSVSVSLGETVQVEMGHVPIIHTTNARYVVVTCYLTVICPSWTSMKAIIFAGATPPIIYFLEIDLIRDALNTYG